MRKLVPAVLVALISSVALADEPTKAYRLTDAQINEIGVALSARPYSEVVDVMAALKAQFAEQVMPAKIAPPATPDTSTPPPQNAGASK